MNCKWAKEINLVHGNKTAWICTSPRREDVLCGHCCLDCSKPYLHNDEIVGCEGVCEAAVLTLRGYDVGDGIVDHLLDKVTELDNIYPPYVAGAATPAPFAVLKMAGASPVNNIGRVQRFQVLVHSRNTMDLSELDELVHKIVDSLDGEEVPAGAGWITPAFIGTSPDYFDDDRQSVMRIAEFEYHYCRGGVAMAEEAKTTSTGPTRPNKPLGKPKRLVALRTCTYRFEDGARTKLYRGVAPEWLSTKQVEELVRYKLLKEE